MDLEGVPRLCVYPLSIDICLVFEERFVVQLCTTVSESLIAAMLILCDEKCYAYRGSVVTHLRVPSGYNYRKRSPLEAVSASLLSCNRLSRGSERAHGDRRIVTAFM
jgi:hypothetical protein